MELHFDVVRQVASTVGESWSNLCYIFFMTVRPDVWKF